MSEDVVAHREDPGGSHTCLECVPRSPLPQAVSGALLGLVLDLAGPGGVSGAQECLGHRGCTDCHLDGPLLLPPAATTQQCFPLSHLLHQEGEGVRSGGPLGGGCILFLPSLDHIFHGLQNILVSPLIVYVQYTLLRNSRASPRLFRASSSTFFFQLVLVLGLLLAAGPLAYVISR